MSSVPTTTTDASDATVASATQQNQVDPSTQQQPTKKARGSKSSSSASGLTKLSVAAVQSHSGAAAPQQAHQQDTSLAGQQPVVHQTFSSANLHFAPVHLGEVPPFPKDISHEDTLDAVQSWIGKTLQTNPMNPVLAHMQDAVHRQRQRVVLGKKRSRATANGTAPSTDAGGATVSDAAAASAGVTTGAATSDDS